MGKLEATGLVCLVFVLFCVCFCLNFGFGFRIGFQLCFWFCPDKLLSKITASSVTLCASAGTENLSFKACYAMKIRFTIITKLNENDYGYLSGVISINSIIPTCLADILHVAAFCSGCVFNIRLQGEWW